MRFVSLSILALIAAQSAHADVENFLPVSLKCPKGGVGTLELIMKNGLGEAQRVTADIDAQGISHLKVEAAPIGGKFAEKMNFNLRSPLTAHDQSFSDKILLTMDGHRKDSCANGKVKKKFEKELARNRREVKKAAAEFEAEMNTADDEGPRARSGE